jgi:hypothetical protein
MYIEAEIYSNGVLDRRRSVGVYEKLNPNSFTYVVIGENQNKPYRLSLKPPSLLEEFMSRPVLVSLVLHSIIKIIIESISLTLH